jgi:Flp pilus assembly protein TadG
MMRRRRVHAGDDRGSELLELAIVLPILLLVCAAIMDFGLMFQRYEVVTNAAREGARLASLPGGYTTADIQGRVNDYLVSGGLTGTATVPPPTYATAAIGGTGPTVRTVTVIVQYPSEFTFIGSFAGLVGGGGWTSITLRAASVMRTESPGTGS